MLPERSFYLTLTHAVSMCMPQAHTGRPSIVFLMRSKEIIEGHLVSL